MQHLTDILLTDRTRRRFVRDVVELIDDEVGRETGLTGLGVRGGYRVIKQLRGNALRDALDDMLEAFVHELDVLFIAYGGPSGFGEFLSNHSSTVARHMLKVTDARRDASRNVSLKRAYDSLSPIAVTRLERSIPRLGEVIQRYLDESFCLRPTVQHAAA